MYNFTNTLFTSFQCVNLVFFDVVITFFLLSSVALNEVRRRSRNKINLLLKKYGWNRSSTRCYTYLSKKLKKKKNHKRFLSWYVLYFKHNIVIMIYLFISICRSTNLNILLLLIFSIDAYACLMFQWQNDWEYRSHIL